MSNAAMINADMLSFWNGQGGHIWVARQAHADFTLAPVMDALVNFAAPRAGETVLDVGCGCGAPTLEFARAVGPSGRVVGMDISGPMLAEGATRAKAAGIANVYWRQDDPATAKLEGFDLLVSAFGVMFFGDMVGAFTNMRRAAKPGARMALVCWRGLADDPWMEVPMNAVAQHLPPRPKGTPNAPSMFAFANPEYVSQVLTAATGRCRGSRNSTWIWISPLAVGWKRPWCSRRRSARSIAGCAISRLRSSPLLPNPCARRWRRIRTARAFACPARCG